jgi:GNAT superfamily N-acetyltransferase
LAAASSSALETSRRKIAILVRSRLKGHGVGWLLMKHMIEFSKHKDLKTVRGHVLSENATMLVMCDELGFHIGDDPDDHTASCRFRKLDSCVSMVEPAKDRMYNNISKAFDRARTRDD